MSKEYLVLTGGRPLYASGHYDVEGARATMRQDQKQHPRRSYKIVKIVEEYAPSVFAGNGGPITSGPKCPVYGVCKHACAGQPDRWCDNQ